MGLWILTATLLAALPATLVINHLHPAKEQSEELTPWIAGHAMQDIRSADPWDVARPNNYVIT